MGKAKRPKRELRNRKVLVAYTDAEHVELEREAIGEHLTLALYCRLLTLGTITRKKELTAKSG